MSVDFFQRIAYRLARNVVLVALLLGLLSAVGQVTVDLRSHINGFNDQIAEVFLVSRNSAQRAVHLLDNTLAEEVVRGLENHAFLHHITLQDDRNNIMAEFSRPHNSARTSWITRLLMDEASTAHRFPLVAENNRLEGYLTIHVDNEVALEPFYSRVLYILVTGLLSNTLLALVLLYIFNRLLTSPLVSIAKRISAIDGQHPNGADLTPPPGHERDELGYIVESTNAFVHEVSETQKALRESEHQLRVVVDASPNLVFVLNKNHQFVFANARTAEFYGCDENQLLGMDYLQLQRAISPQEAGRTADELKRVLENGERVVQDDAILSDHYHVERILQLVRLPFQFSGETCVLTIAGDITDRVAAEARVERLAFYDTLTGLPNRNLIHDRLKMDLARTSRTGLHGALLFIDIDDFKRINDTMGHSVGDQILVSLTEQMKTQMRRTDTLARIGGDEFVLSLPDLSSQQKEAEVQAERLADALNKRICAPICVGSNEFRMSASIGIMMYSREEESVDELLRFADTAMYQAKRMGKNRHQLFHPSMAKEASRLVQLEQDLRQAVAERQFEVYLQPIFSLSTGRFASAEALLRWAHPTKGLLTPLHFMSFLENSNMVGEVGQIVLEAVCVYLKTSQPGPVLPDNLRISINISARELYQPDFVQRVKETLDRYELPGSRLEFEITEGVALQSIADAIQVMQQIKALGITFALDDFGTGYSSLSYLKQLPVDTVKIDKSFINGITYDTQDAALVACIMAIADTLDLNTVAEGVEDQDQAAWLRRYQDIRMQGFLYSRPMPISQFHEQWSILSQGVPSVRG